MLPRRRAQPPKNPVIDNVDSGCMWEQVCQVSLFGLNGEQTFITAAISHTFSVLSASAYVSYDIRTRNIIHPFCGTDGLKVCPANLNFQLIDVCEVWVRGVDKPRENNLISKKFSFFHLGRFFLLCNMLSIFAHDQLQSILMFLQRRSQFLVLLLQRPDVPEG